MKLFIEIIIFLLLAYTVFFYIRTKIFIKKSAKKKNKDQANNKQMIISIPLLREQNCICDTVKYFKEINEDIPIVLITTQKEIKENINNEKTTQDIIKEKILKQYENVYWIDYPYEEGYMAEQLNYMLYNLDKIFNKPIDLKNTYLVLYNADSRPSKHTFEEIKENLKDANKVIQQYSYCMGNYEKLSYILKGFAIYQSNFEIKTGLVKSFFKINL